MTQANQKVETLCWKLFGFCTEFKPDKLDVIIQPLATMNWILSKVLYVMAYKVSALCRLLWGTFILTILYLHTHMYYGFSIRRAFHFLQLCAKLNRVVLCDRQQTAVCIFPHRVFAVVVWQYVPRMGKTLPTYFPMRDFFMISHGLLID